MCKMTLRKQGIKPYLLKESKRKNGKRTRWLRYVQGPSRVSSQKSNVSSNETKRTFVSKTRYTRKRSGLSRTRPSTKTQMRYQPSKDSSRTNEKMSRKQRGSNWRKLWANSFRDYRRGLRTTSKTSSTTWTKSMLNRLSVFGISLRNSRHKWQS